ncbi:unnamed protein product, partial [Polarella glacialis]
EVINPLLSWTTSNIAGRHGARWLYRDDIDWVRGLLDRSPVLKFIGLHSSLLDRQPLSHLLRPGSCIRYLLEQALPMIFADVQGSSQKLGLLPHALKLPDLEFVD